jgi:dipeptidyl aminopeptidase/acylaminoacyl peptidase
VVLLSLFTVSPAASRSITPEDLWKVRRLGAPTIAPDGSRVVCEVTTWNMEKDEPRSELWLFASDGSGQTPLTNSGGRNSSPRWSPDGKLIAFASQRAGDTVAQIYVIDPAGGESRRVSKLPYAASSLKWSPDSKTIYAIAWTWPGCATDAEHKRREQELKDNKAKGVVITEAAYRYWDRWLSDGKRPTVVAVDLATGNHRNVLAHTGKHLLPTEPSANDFDISPDSKELCFAADSTADYGADYNLDLYSLDLTTPNAAIKLLTADNPGSDGQPAYSPDGKRIAFVRQTVKYFYADRARVMVYDRATGKSTEFCPPGRPLDRSAGNLRWLPIDDAQGGATVLAEVEDCGYVRLGLFSATDPARLLPGPSGDRSPDVARANATVAFLRSSFDRPGQLYVGDPRGNKRRVDKFNDDITSEWKLGKVEEQNIPGAGDKPIQTWIVYPPNFDPTKKWPIVQMVHGGPHNAITNEFSYRWHPHVWAARGWVVAIVNFHGSSGFGQEFTDSITGDLGTKPFDDVMKVTDWLLKKPWADGDRLAAAGGSYGGYMMAWMNGHTDRFKAMVCHAGVYNWHSMMASDSVRGRERSLGAPPWGDLTRVDKQNAQRLASNFKTPTLVVHGEKDYRVPVTQGFEYYNTLRQKGVPTRLLYYPDENHWVLKAHNALLWHREVFGWIEKYCGAGPK